ncbi:AAA family ATPase, partial [Cylindrospermopsis raciborskii]|uniref:AAA family ATPase n=1 Tax=Cylindrospermopsis raciborskii TaxID=77022 RepID=UPI001C42F328
MDYINYQALGIAILRTREPSQVNQYLPSELLHKEKVRSVVLIDEIDKAPRDFCNDVLNELEHIYFRVLELGNEKIEADPELQPIVIITSNSEKDLPEPFLRRCIYYNLPFPDKKSLQDIITNHLGTYVGNSNPFLQTALDLFYRFRAPQSGLRKKPATAELLNWLITLQKFTGDTNNPFTQPDKILCTLSTLI